jgi:microcystin synthetase protein McyJ
MSKNYSVAEIQSFYAERHKIRPGIFGTKPYANYGYWLRDNMTIDEACDAMTDLVATALELKESDHLLECGCGYGASAIYLAQKYQPAKILGLDVSEVRIEEGQGMVREYGLEEKVAIAFGDAAKMPEIATASFDKIMAIECAFHFNTRQLFFQEAFRVLKPGGILVVVDILPAKDFPLEQHTLEEIRYFLSADVRMYADTNIYSQQTYEEYLQAAGFNPVKLQSIKDKVVMQFADHLDHAPVQNPEVAEKVKRYARAFRELLMVYGDYVLVTAKKPA